jgi:hypothetical protein
MVLLMQGIVLRDEQPLGPLMPRHAHLKLHLVLVSSTNCNTHLPAVAYVHRVTATTTNVVVRVVRVVRVVVTAAASW